MKAHPLADVFPPMGKDELAALTDSIKTFGFLPRFPIVTYEGKILDGRHRWEICQRLGVNPVVEAYLGKDPVGYVLSANLARRHMNESQRAMVADKLATLQQGRKAKAQIQASSQAEAAKRLSVSRSSVQAARAVRKKGTAEIIEAVERGDLSVSKAAKTLKPTVSPGMISRKPSGAPSTPTEPLKLTFPESLLSRIALAPLKCDSKTLALEMVDAGYKLLNGVHVESSDRLELRSIRDYLRDCAKKIEVEAAS